MAEAEDSPAVETPAVIEASELPPQVATPLRRALQV